jgi:hypothetical protein
LKYKDFYFVQLTLPFSFKLHAAHDYLWKELYEAKWGPLPLSPPHTSSSHFYENIPWHQIYSQKRITEKNWNAGKYNRTNFGGHEKFVVSVAFMDGMVVSSSGIFSPLSYFK